eukprot:205031-Pleurochrysis_carterae.AAC.1
MSMRAADCATQHQSASEHQSCACCCRNSGPRGRSVPHSRVSIKACKLACDENHGWKSTRPTPLKKLEEVTRCYTKDKAL